MQSEHRSSIQALRARWAHAASFFVPFLSPSFNWFDRSIKKAIGRVASRRLRLAPY